MKNYRPLVTCLAVACMAGPIGAAPPPVSSFTNFAQIESLKISPGGKFLALTKRSGGHETISVLRYPELSVSTHAHFGDLMDIERFEWANDGRLLIQPAQRFLGYTAYNAPTGEIIGLNVGSNKADMLYGFRAGRATTGTIVPGRSSTATYARLVDLLPDDPDHVLIQTRDYRYEGGSNSVQRMNVKTGRLARLAGSPVDMAEYITDLKHELLFVSGINAEGDFQTYRFQPQTKTWNLISSGNENEGGVLLPFQDTPVPDVFLALDSVATSTDALVSWNSTTQERKMLFHSENSDLSLAGVDPEGRAWMYRYDDHTPQYWYPDAEHPLARAHRSLRAGYKDANIYFTSATRDMSLAVAEVSAPRIPPVFLLVDVKNLKLLQRLPAFPDIQPDDLAPTDPIEVVVRDGMKIRGYLTTPKGSSMKGLPMIVVPHGGPHGLFDRYDFNAEVQLLASRGFAVLQVNFRGSGGRGRDFLTAGYGKWGREMQDDITDAVKWAIAYGVADRNRICIYGGSYGAYAALTGTYREPDMFKCAVGMSGVYDLPLMFEKGDIQTLDRGLRYLRSAVGTDEADMRSRSPVYNADKIKAAVMLIHGRDDKRAPIAHAQRMRSALQKAGKDPVWISEGGEAHGIFNEGNRAQVYEQMLAFFAKHIGSAEPEEN